MSQISPNGRRKRCAQVVALALVAGALCLGLTGCGGGATFNGTKRGSGGESPAAGEFNKQNAEDYGAVVENEFRSPLVEPRSTFSADVNTASYSNVRRFITEGKLPPKDAVLLAELVNYFQIGRASCRDRV